MSTKPNEINKRELLTSTGAAAAGLAMMTAGGVGFSAGQAVAQTADSTPSPFTTRGPAPKSSIEIHTRLNLKATPITPEAFAPFGVLLTESGRQRLPINTYGDKLDLFREDFSSDQPIEWFIVNGRPRWNGVLFVERHMQLTQTFIPLGKPLLTVVARPGAPEENGFPVVAELKAFLVPGDTPFQLYRGTWHENPMPLSNDTRFVVTSHANLTLGHQQNPDPKLKNLPVDLERRWYKAGGYELTIES